MLDRRNGMTKVPNEADPLAAVPTVQVSAENAPGDSGPAPQTDKPAPIPEPPQNTIGDQDLENIKLES